MGEDSMYVGLKNKQEGMNFITQEECMDMNGSSYTLLSVNENYID